MFYHIFRFASGRKIYFSLSSSLCRLRPSATFAPLSPLPLCRRGGRHTFGKPQKYAKAFQRGGEKSAFYSWVFRPLFGFSPMVAQENLLGCRPLSAPPEKALYFLRAYTLYPCALYCLAGVWLLCGGFRFAAYWPLCLCSGVFYLAGER